jgi:hypothetical protein
LTYYNPGVAPGSTALPTFNITGDLMPTSTNTYSLGATGATWKEIVMGPGTLTIVSGSGNTAATLGANLSGIAYTQSGFASPFINVGPAIDPNAPVGTVGGWYIGPTGTAGGPDFDLITQQIKPDGSGFTGPLYSLTHVGSTGATGSTGAQGAPGTPALAKFNQYLQYSIGYTGNTGTGYTGATGNFGYNATGIAAGQWNTISTWDIPLTSANNSAVLVNGTSYVFNIQATLVTTGPSLEPTGGLQLQFQNSEGAPFYPDTTANTVLPCPNNSVNETFISTGNVISTNMFNFTDTVHVTTGTTNHINVYVNVGHKSGGGGWAPTYYSLFLYINQIN